MGDHLGVYASYSPGTKVAKLMGKARRTNGQRDAIDHKFGHAPPGECPLDIQLRTALEAIFCGMSMDDWDCVAEGAAMIQDIELRVRRPMP